MQTTTQTTKTVHLSDGTQYEGTLVVVNEQTRGMSSRRQYRLYWQNPAEGGRYAMPAYGACSEPFFARECDAIARGMKDFGIKAERAAW